MLIEELRRELPGAALENVEPRAHAIRYRLLSKELRRIVNALYRRGGTMDYGELASQTGCSLAAIQRLQDEEFVYALPSLREPQRVVMPLELVFATPLAEPEQDTLVEAIKRLAAPVVETIASGLNLHASDDLHRRAVLHRHLTGGETFTGISSAATDLLRWLEERGWKAALKEILKQVGAPPAVRSLPMNVLVNHALHENGPVGELAGRFLLMPISPTVAGVPCELRDRVVEVLARSPGASAGCRPDPAARYDSKEGALRGDLMRYLLLLEHDPPAITQKRTLNRVDMRRIAKRAGWDEEVVARLTQAALWMQLVIVREGTAGVDPAGASLLTKPPAEFFRGLAKRYRETNLQPAGIPWLEKSAVAKINEAVRLELLRTLSGPQSWACAHCLVRRVSGSPIFKRLTPWQSEDHDKTAGLFLGGHLDLLHDLGFLEFSRRKEGRVGSIRWTATGDGALGKGPLPPAAAADGTIVVQPTGEIIAPTGIPYTDLARLARAADVKSVDAVAVFALTRAGILRAAQRGDDPRALGEFLAARSRRPLPQPVAFLLEEAGSRMGEVEIVPCSALVKIKNPVLAKTLGFGLVPVAEGLAMLPADMDPALLREALKRAGYVPAMPPPPPVEVQTHDTCTCATQASDAAGILWRLRHSLEEMEPVEITIHGGRRHRCYVDGIDGDRLEASEEGSGRPLVVSVAAILTARVIPS